MKKIMIDVSMIMVGTRFTGIPRVVMEVCKRLANKKDIELVFLEYHQKKDCYEIIDTNRFIAFCVNRSENRKQMRTGRFLSFDCLKDDEKKLSEANLDIPNKVRTELQENEQATSSVIFLDLDTVWKTRVRRSFLYPKLKEQNITIVSHIYDIIPITHPQFCITDDMLCFVDYIGAAMSHADKVIVNSKATKHAIDKMCDDIACEKKDIRVIPLGGNFAARSNNKGNTDSTGNQTSVHTDKHVSEFDGEDEVGQNKNIRPEIKKIGENKKYLLTVGTIEPRKNHKLLIDAYEKGLKDNDISVVIVGYKGWNVDELIERIQKHPDYQTGIYYPTDVNDDELQYLYKHCCALAFPSRIEGYGLPIMEAFSKGVCVIASNTEINTEIGGDCAIYFEDDNAEDLVRAAVELADDNQAQESIKAKISQFKFPTWEESGLLFYEVLRAI